MPIFLQCFQCFIENANSLLSPLDERYIHTDVMLYIRCNEALSCLRSQLPRSRAAQVFQVIYLGTDLETGWPEVG